MSAPKWSVGMRMLAPGIYSDGKTIHMDGVEMCESMGYPATRENQRIVEDAARRALADTIPGAKMEVVEKSSR